MQVLGNGVLRPDPAPAAATSSFGNGGVVGMPSNEQPQPASTPSPSIAPLPRRVPLSRQHRPRPPPATPATYLSQCKTITLGQRSPLYRRQPDVWATASFLAGSRRQRRPDKRIVHPRERRRSEQQDRGRPTANWHRLCRLLWTRRVFWTNILSVPVDTSAGNGGTGADIMVGGGQHPRALASSTRMAGATFGLHLLDRQRASGSASSPSWRSPSP